MSKTRGAILVNAGLLAVLAGVSLAPSADAQRGTARARGDYSMVAGRIQGGNAAVVYVLDAANQEMIALRWNESTKSLEGVGFRDLNQDATAEPGR
ncbi:MAG: hypothetical protein ACKVU4_10130 [Phycisphaerales bacterium]